MLMQQTQCKKCTNAEIYGNVHVIAAESYELDLENYSLTLVPCEIFPTALPSKSDTLY